MTDHFFSLFTDPAPLSLLRQLGLIALCLLGGIALSRWLRARFMLPGDDVPQSLVMQIGVKSFVGMPMKW